MTSSPAADESTAIIKVASFWVDDVLFGVEVMRVSEVLHALEIEPVPGAPVGVLGLASQRGQVIAVIDARTRLGLPPQSEDSGTVFLLIGSGSQFDCLVVDREDEVVELDAMARSDPPETIHSDIRSHVDGVFQQDNGLLLMLNIDRLLAVAESKGASSNASTGH